MGRVGRTLCWGGVVLGLWGLGEWWTLPTGERPARLSQQEITITVEPVLEAEAVRKDFHKSLTERRITPVLVTIRNQRQEPIRVIADSIQLIDAADTRYRNLSVSDVLQAAAAGARATRRPPIRPPIPLPLPPRRAPAGGGQMSDLEMTLRSKELGERLVPPQSEERGYVFFQVAGGAKTWQGARVYIPHLRGLKTGERLLFFEIDLKPGGDEGRREKE